MSALLETDSWKTAIQTEISNGSGKTVNDRREKSLSRLPGRGALPSETSSNAASPWQPAPSGEAAASDIATGAGPSPGLPLPPDIALAVVTDAPPTAAAYAAERDFLPSPRHGEPVQARDFPLLEPRRQAGMAARHDAGPRSGAGNPAAAQPGLVIGRIDVVVVAAPAALPAQAPAPGERGFLSRNYLKRL
jgi:hypothetical protein